VCESSDSSPLTKEAVWYRLFDLAKSARLKLVITVLLDWFWEEIAQQNKYPAIYHKVTPYLQSWDLEKCMAQYSS
jgi:hypothetical protein